MAITVSIIRKLQTTCDLTTFLSSDNSLALDLRSELQVTVFTLFLAAAAQSRVRLRTWDGGGADVAMCNSAAA